jgi:LacI family sucrose operon transcriptional repressor
METIPYPVTRIRDVAKLAKTSVSTVSRVLNNSGYVKAEVRTRIEAVIAETGYVPSSLAKDLQRQQSSLVGVIIPKINSYTSGEMVAGLSSVLNAQRYSVLLASTDNHPQSELDSLKLFREKRVNGVLLLGTELSEAHRLAMAQMPVPVVVIAQDAARHGISSVLQDERAAAAALTRYLLACGHRRIGLLGVHEFDVQVGIERKQGFIDALREAGIEPEPALMVQGGFDFQSAASGVDHILAQGEAPSAILAVTDRLAVGAISRLTERGIAVPAAISVAGMGDIDLAAVFQPRITTVRYDYFQTGARAAALLVEAMQGELTVAQKIIMGYQLKIRDSVRDLNT